MIRMFIVLHMTNIRHLHYLIITKTPNPTTQAGILSFPKITHVTKSIVFYNLLANGCFVIFAVPISIYILSLQLPYLPEATSLSPFFLVGSLILVSGLVIYSIPQPAKHDSRNG